MQTTNLQELASSTSWDCVSVSLPLQLCPACSKGIEPRWRGRWALIAAPRSRPRVDGAGGWIYAVGGGIRVWVAGVVGCSGTRRRLRLRRQSNEVLVNRPVAFYATMSSTAANAVKHYPMGLDSRRGASFLLSFAHLEEVCYGWMPVTERAASCYGSPCSSLHDVVQSNRRFLTSFFIHLLALRIVLFLHQLWSNLPCCSLFTS